VGDEEHGKKGFGPAGAKNQRGARAASWPDAEEVQGWGTILPRVKRNLHFPAHPFEKPTRRHMKSGDIENISIFI
jgi:hypothetical protein